MNGTIINIQDLIDEFNAELPRVYDNNGEQQIDEDKLEKAIEDAELHLLSYLKKVNIDIYNPSVKLIRELRRPMLSLTRKYYSNNNGAITENIISDYDSTINWLKDVAKGRVQLTSVVSKGSGWKNIQMVI